MIGKYGGLKLHTPFDNRSKHHSSARTTSIIKNNMKYLNLKSLCLLYRHSDDRIDVKLCILYPNFSTQMVLFFITFLLTGFMTSLHAQEMIENNLHIRSNDPTVTVNITNKNGNTNPQNGDEITITLSGLPATKKAVVKAGRSFGNKDFNEWEIESQSNSFTFTMPDYKLFIDIDVKYITIPTTYSLSIETTGLSSATVPVTVTGNDITGANSLYQVNPTTEVTASLPVSLPNRVSLLAVEGRSTDGSWFMNSVNNDGSYSNQIIFNMPEKDVILRFVFKEEAAPGPGPGPGPNPSPGPDDPDEPVNPDEPDEPDPGPVANEPISGGGIHLRGSEGMLHISTDSPASAHIYTFAGQLVQTVSLAGGEQAISLPRRPYIVRVGGQSFKVSL